MEELVVVWETYTPEGQRWFCPSCDAPHKTFEGALRCCPAGTPLKQGIAFDKSRAAINVIPGRPITKKEGA